MPRRKAISLAALLAILLAAGAVQMGTGDALGGFHWPETAQFMQLRAKRLGIAATVGGSLALAGVLLQALLRNPLASPDLLGVTSGAGLGVAIVTVLGGASGGAAGPGLETLAALVGSGATLGVVLAWTVRRGGIDVVSLVLVGVIVGMTCSGATLLLHQMLPDGGAAARAWFLGSLNENAPPGLVLAGGAALLGCLALALASARAMDAACLAEDEARSLGVRLARLRLLLFSAAGILTTISVVLAGPIGFVGLVIPHAVRLLMGPHHGPLALGATLAGAATVVGADAAISAFLLPGYRRMPLGVITAVLGGPLFLLLLRSMLRRTSL
ncbi:MAG TPA: iron ABC transporter permease [Phycisphaerales bacterium]|nr:iron ABC transporter permease [Phycisphaerales bacterium]